MCKFCIDPNENPFVANSRLAEELSEAGPAMLVPVAKRLVAHMLESAHEEGVGFDDAIRGLSRALVDVIGVFADPTYLRILVAQVCVEVAGDSWSREERESTMAEIDAAGARWIAQAAPPAEDVPTGVFGPKGGEA